MKTPVVLISAIALAVTAFGAARVPAATGHAQAASSASIPLFTQVTAGYTFDCALTKEATVVC